jgi:hypothetical protein
MISATFFISYLLQSADLIDFFFSTYILLLVLSSFHHSTWKCYFVRIMLNQVNLCIFILFKLISFIFFLFSSPISFLESPFIRLIYFSPSCPFNTLNDKTFRFFLFHSLLFSPNFGKIDLFLFL